MDSRTWAQSSSHLPIGLASPFKTKLLTSVSSIIASETEGLGINIMFRARPGSFPWIETGLKWKKLERIRFWRERWDMLMSLVFNLGRRRDASATAIARVASTCKHFEAFGSPQGGFVSSMPCRFFHIFWLDLYRNLCSGFWRRAWVGDNVLEVI